MNTVAEYFGIYDILGGNYAIMKGDNSFSHTFLHLQSGFQHKHIIMLQVFRHTKRDLKNVKASRKAVQQKEQVQMNRCYMTSFLCAPLRQLQCK